MTQDPPAPASQRTRWFVLTAVSLGLLLATVDTSILYVVAPLLTDELSASVSESLWIINMYPLVMTGLLLGTGTLGDRFGHKLVFQIGISAFGIASLLAAFSPNAWVLIVARALLAVGAALMLPATLAIIRFTFEDEDERNVAIAVWSSVSIGGIAFGPLVGGLLLEWFWWGSVFLINVPFALVTFLLTAMYAPAARASARTSWDLLSSVLALVGLTGLVAAIKQGVVSAPSGVFITGALATSFVCFWWFARRQRRLPTPLLDFSVFRSRSVVAGVLAAGLATFVFAGVGTVTSQHFQLARGFSPLQSGLLLAAIAAGATVTSLLAGSVLSRVGPRRLLGAGCVVAGGGYALATLVLEANLWMFAVSLFLAGTGIGVLITVASSTIISNVSADRAGMASGVEEVSYEFGSLISVTLLGSIYAAFMAREPSCGAEGYQVSLALAAAACLVGFMGIVLLLRSDRALSR
ncbi:MFS transporter [Corynebacterium sp. H78]|uniref:MFS transporter n=1 Tax=Corynebacterium sp. H78 TaxID=3133417 RepID=UPI0030A37824